VNCSATPIDEAASETSFAFETYDPRAPACRARAPTRTSTSTSSKGVHALPGRTVGEGGPGTRPAAEELPHAYYNGRRAARDCSGEPAGRCPAVRRAAHLTDRPRWSGSPAVRRNFLPPARWKRLSQAGCRVVGGLSAGYRRVSGVSARPAGWRAVGCPARRRWITLAADATLSAPLVLGAALSHRAGGGSPVNGDLDETCPVHAAMLASARYADRLRERPSRPPAPGQ